MVLLPWSLLETIVLTWTPFPKSPSFTAFGNYGQLLLRAARYSVAKEVPLHPLSALGSLTVRAVMKPCIDVHKYTYVFSVHTNGGGRGWIVRRKVTRQNEEKFGFALRKICEYVLCCGLPVGEVEGWKPHDLSHFKVARTKPLGLYSTENPAVSGDSGWTKWPSAIGLFHPWFQWVSENPLDLVGIIKPRTHEYSSHTRMLISLLDLWSFWQS